MYGDDARMIFPYSLLRTIKKARYTESEYWGRAEGPHHVDSTPFFNWVAIKELT